MKKEGSDSERNGNSHHTVIHNNIDSVVKSPVAYHLIQLSATVITSLYNNHGNRLRYCSIGSDGFRL
jgi:hypothetical protein